MTSSGLTRPAATLWPSRCGGSPASRCPCWSPPAPRPPRIRSRRRPPPPHGWHELLAALPASEVIDLAPLDLWQIQNLLPRTVTAAQARLVARQSRGNPFWAKEIVASLGSAGSQVPALARTLTDRLSRSLSADAATALAVVAAAGRIGVPEALAVLDQLDDPAAAVDEAVLAGVLVESRGPNRRCRIR